MVPACLISDVQFGSSFLPPFLCHPVGRLWARGLPTRSQMGGQKLVWVQFFVVKLVTSGHWPTDEKHSNWPLLGSTVPLKAL